MTGLSGLRELISQLARLFTESARGLRRTVRELDAQMLALGGERTAIVIAGLLVDAARQFRVDGVGFHSMGWDGVRWSPGTVHTQAGAFEVSGGSVGGLAPGQWYFCKLDTERRAVVANTAPPGFGEVLLCVAKAAPGPEVSASCIPALGMLLNPNVRSGREA